jgi:hypothetical protein
VALAELGLRVLGNIAHTHFRFVFEPHACYSYLTLLLWQQAGSECKRQERERFTTWTRVRKPATLNPIRRYTDHSNLS